MSASKTVIKAFVKRIVSLDGGTVQFPVKYMPDDVTTAVEAAQTTANEAKTAAATAQSTANEAKTAAATAQSTANTAVIPSRQQSSSDDNICNYFMYNKYAEYAETALLLGTAGGSNLGIIVNEECPSVAFVPPVKISEQADFEFRRASEAYKHPLITGIGGIVIYSSTSGSTKRFKITVNDSGTISATEVTT